MGRGASKVGGGRAKSGENNLAVPSDWKEYATEEIDTFMAGMSMTFPTPKGNLNVTIDRPGMFATETLYDGEVVNKDNGKVIYKGANLTISKLRKQLKKAVIQ